MFQFLLRRAVTVTLCLLLYAANAEALPRWASWGRPRSEGSKYAGVETRPRWASRGWLRSVNWKYTGVVLTQFAMANLDARTSLRCFHRFWSCHEANPLLGGHPSPARIYSQLNLQIAGLAVMELYLKDSARRKKSTGLAWLVGPAVSLSINATTTVGNLRQYNKYAAQCRANAKLVR